jgi:anthranilate phosphoribosyltransferase
MVDHGVISFGTLTLEDLGLPSYPIGAFRGGDPTANAQICRDILVERAPGPFRDVVLANAGLALYVAKMAPTPYDGVRLAQDSIDGGRAAGVLEALVARAGRSSERRDA